MNKNSASQHYPRGYSFVFRLFCSRHGQERLRAKSDERKKPQEGVKRSIYRGLARINARELEYSLQMVTHNTTDFFKIETILLINPFGD